MTLYILAIILFYPVVAGFYMLTGITDIHHLQPTRTYRRIDVSTLLATISKTAHFEPLQLAGIHSGDGGEDSPGIVLQSLVPVHSSLLPLAHRPAVLLHLL